MENSFIKEILETRQRIEEDTSTEAHYMSDQREIDFKKMMVDLENHFNDSITNGIDVFEKVIEDLMKMTNGYISMDLNEVFDMILVFHDFYPTEIVPANESTYENEGNCSICLSDYSNQKKRIQCGHVFCKGCIEEWNRFNFNCPVCRQENQPDTEKIKEEGISFFGRDILNGETNNNKFKWYTWIVMKSLSYNGENITWKQLKRAFTKLSYWQFCEVSFSDTLNNIKNILNAIYDFHFGTHSLERSMDPYW